MSTAFAPSTSVAHASAASGVRPCSVCRSTRRASRSASGVAQNQVSSKRVRAPDPRLAVGQQVVALDDDDPHGFLDGDLARHALVDHAMEARRVDGVAALGAQPVEQRDEAPAVEGLDRTLAVVQSEPVEGRVRQVEPVHRQVDGDARGCGD